MLQPGHEVPSKPTRTCSDGVYVGTSLKANKLRFMNFTNCMFNCVEIRLGGSVILASDGEEAIAIEFRWMVEYR